jgi:hypothetical protein
MAMIKYITKGEIDRKKWDHCIETSRQNLIYGFSWYLDLISENWDGLVLEDYKAIMPLPYKIRFGIKYLYQPVYGQQLGIYSRLYTDANLTQSFLSKIPDEFRYVDYNLNYLQQEGFEGTKFSKRVNYELKLNTPYDDIESRFSDNTRRNIQKAILQIELEEKVSVPEIVKLKREFEKGRRSPEFYQWLNNYMSRLIQMGKGRIIGVKAGDDLVAAAFVVICMNRIYYLVPVSNEKGKKLRAMFAIIDHIIGKYADTGLILDFEGSIIKGIARFFAGFGAEEKNYHNIRINRLPFPLNILKK